MSERLCKIENTGVEKEPLRITAFCGNNHETMVQIVQGDSDDVIRLSVNDAYQLISELTKWIKHDSKRKVEKIQKKIDENKELKKTIFQEMINCERFINDLEVLEIPLMLLKNQ